jgi:8-amino-7-oxononanoate synthase
LTERYSAHIILDEAHSTGLRSSKKDHEGIDIRVHTFGKAVGIHGACVASDAAIKNLLVNFSRPFIYTTAPADHSVVSVSCAFDFLAGNPGLEFELAANIEYFRSLAVGLKGWNRSTTQIQVVLVPGIEGVTKAASQLQGAGFDVRPILSPTVKEGEERLRICLHAFNTKEEIKSLIGEMKALGL